MKLVDLHVHSNASDGTCSPTQVTELAQKMNLEAIALTDHDTIDGIPEALASAEKLGVELIPGIELSSEYKQAEIHLLGLFINIDDQQFLDALEKLRRIRDVRNEQMIRRFYENGIVITPEELTAGAPFSVVTRAHFARVLAEKGLAKNMTCAFKKYLEYGGPFCPKKEQINPEYAMELLRKNRAFSVLAHPVQYHLGWEGTEALIRYLKELGLDGLEVYHSSNNQYESGRLKDLAKKYSLFPTGGSDFHGSNKPDIQIGFGRGGLRVSSLLLSDIKNHSRRLS